MESDCLWEKPRNMCVSIYIYIHRCTHTYVHDDDDDEEEEDDEHKEEEDDNDHHHRHHPDNYHEVIIIIMIMMFMMTAIPAVSWIRAKSNPGSTKRRDVGTLPFFKPGLPWNQSSNFPEPREDPKSRSPNSGL